jgi:hypothetical protein
MPKKSRDKAHEKAVDKHRNTKDDDIIHILKDNHNRNICQDLDDLEQ